jgi:predicted metalloprotease
VASDSFTHGTSEQRARWFRTGFDSGRPEDCDTFSGDV